MRLGRFVVVLLLFSMMVSMTPQSTTALHQDLHLGPFIEKIVFNVITQDDVQVQHLIEDEIDLIGDMVNPAFLIELEEAERAFEEAQGRVDELSSLNIRNCIIEIDKIMTENNYLETIFEKKIGDTNKIEKIFKTVPLFSKK